MATEMLAVVVGTRGRLSLPPHLVTTPTLEALGAADVTNMIEIGRGTMIVETGMDIVEEGGALIVIVITLLLATCTIPRGNIRRGEGGTVVVTMVTAGRREEDMEAIEVVGGAVGVVTEEETGADSLSLEVGVYVLKKTQQWALYAFIYKLASILLKFQGATNNVSCVSLRNFKDLLMYNM